MDFMDLAKQRVTVRKFDKRPVMAAELEQILEAGRWSPTAVNAQPQRILVLQTAEQLAAVRQFCTFGYDQKYVDLSKECDDRANGQINLYYGAPLVLFVCYDKTACWTHPQSGKSSGETDATLVAAHMMYEATSLGLGSAWISYFDEAKARALLHLPESWQPVCMLYIGEKAADFVPNTHLGGHRKPLSETCFFGTLPAADGTEKQS